MASIERTAYPKLKVNISQKELHEKYSLLLPEIQNAYSSVKSDDFVVRYLTLLKCFQHLGYFPDEDEIPSIIVKHIANQLSLKKSIDNVKYTRKGTLYKHHALIRDFLKVKQYDKHAQELLINVVTKNSYTMDNPADLINSAIDVLIKNSYELPAYYHIDKLTLEIRTQVLNEILKTVSETLSEETKETLDNLLKVDDENNFCDFKYLKEPSKKPTFKNMKDLISKLNFTESLGNYEEVLSFIPYTKIKHFAKEAYSLKASELKDYSDSKRYTLLISFLHICRARLRDDLVEMFIKSINKATNRSKEELKKIHDKLRSKTEKIVSAFTELLINANEIENNEKLGKSVRNLISSYGGQESLYSDCTTINYYKDDNFYIFLHKFLGN